MAEVPQVDLTHLPTAEQERVELSASNIIGGAVEPDYESDDSDVQELRRSKRGVPRVSYEPTVDDQELELRQKRIMNKILSYIPLDLRLPITSDEMEWFSRDDVYVTERQFDESDEAFNNWVWPNELMRVDLSEEERRSQYQILEILWDVADDEIYKQFAVALMYKHTVKILCQLWGPIDEWVWKNGVEPEDYSQAQRDETGKLARECVDLIEEQWEYDWPANFMIRPHFFPYNIRGNLGIMAATHLEAVQQAALRIDREVEAYMEKHHPLMSEAPYAFEGVDEEKVGELGEAVEPNKLKATLLEAIREEIRGARLPAPPPPPPAPIEVHIVQKESEGTGDAIRWAFGLALSLWVVYNMEN